MRCSFLWNLVLSTAVVSGLFSGVLAADGTHPLDTAATAESQAAETPVAKKEKDRDATSAAVPPKSSAPTPAKRSAAVDATADEAAKPLRAKSSGSKHAASGLTPIPESLKSEPAAVSASKLEQAANPPKPKPSDELLQPIADSMESGPISIEAASFKGVTPGTSKKEEVEAAWGAPKETAQQDNNLVQLFTVEPFQRVEVTYAGDVVSSVVIRLDRAFPAALVAKQLDLVTIRPVLVSNELGEVLGLAYPERGVLFSFETGKDPGKPSMKVSQLVLEPISAEPFVLRAETTIESRFDLSRRDLEMAISLDPDNARAHWLFSRVLVAMDERDKAIDEASDAIRLDPENAKYQVARAQMLALVGRLPEAIEDAQSALEISEGRPHVKAQALCMLGDLLASGPAPDYKKALSYHTQALQLADSLIDDPHPAIRTAAKQVLLDAHLGASHDIAWGDWKEKDKAVARWLDRAMSIANELAKNDAIGREQVLRVHTRAMAVYVGVRGSIDPGPTIRAATRIGDELIAASRDPVHKAQLQWDLGMSLYDAVQVYQMRSEPENALKIGQKAAEYLSQANAAKKSDSSALLLGRLYFRIGTIYAIHSQDHETAVSWFDKALPLLERPSIEDLAADLGRHGESYVSMGVSYWETDHRDKAVRLTERGIQWMEQAAKQGAIDRSSLSIPYGNLAAMHRTLGATDRAERFQEMAARTKGETLR